MWYKQTYSYKQAKYSYSLLDKISLMNLNIYIELIIYR